MPYLAFELDAKKKVPLVARAAGCSPADVAWSLLELWELVWVSKRDILSDIEVRGCIGTGRPLLEALLAFGFLEDLTAQLDDTPSFRVRGADRYLRLSEARKKGAAATNKKRAERALSDAQASQEVAQATHERTLPDALSASSEQRAAKVEQRKVEDPPPPPREVLPVVVEAPTKPPDQWGGEDFWAWFQSKRQAAGFVAERGPPPRLSFWWSPLMMELNGDVERLKEATYRFGEDPYWQAKNLPFNGFKTNWPNYVPRGGANASA